MCLPSATPTSTDLKEDSCGGSQDHATAFSDYAKMRDTLNATGRKVYFSLCGWNEWYAPPDPSVGYKGGYSLGNSWRIYGDGKNWGALSGAVNTMARITNYTGRTLPPHVLLSQLLISCVP